MVMSNKSCCNEAKHREHLTVGKRTTVNIRYLFYAEFVSPISYTTLKLHCNALFMYTCTTIIALLHMQRVSERNYVSKPSCSY